MVSFSNLDIKRISLHVKRNLMSFQIKPKPCKFYNQRLFDKKEKSPKALDVNYIPPKAEPDK